MGFSQALSGLNAAATNLDVLGNNIANSQTAGFKGGRTLFADIYAGADAGLGTKISAVLQNFNSGTLENTGRNLDVAIGGKGFLRFVQNDQVAYSRNGQLNLDSSGFIVNAQGGQLTGYPAGDIGGDPQPIRVPPTGLEAAATTSITTTINLDAGSDEIDRGIVPFDSTDSSTYTYTNNVTVYDSQGNDHISTAYYTKTASNTWELRVARGTELAPEVGTLNFDTSGLMVGSSGLGSFTFVPGAGVANMDIALNFDGTTQFGNDFELGGTFQDGYRSGSLISVSIDDQGNVIGNYSNEQNRTLSTILVANFTNPEGLKPNGDNLWLETTASGQALTGAPGSGQFGTISSGVVENSNVDLTKELVNLIIAQRNYQANAQTIKVQDEVLQSAVNL